MAVNSTAVWRARPSGANDNGGGYDAGIAGAATDYSQQNTAQATGTNGSTSGAGSTTFTDSTAAAFTAAMVGNCIQIASGTNFQAGFYFVTAFTNANSVVLDRTPSSGGAGSAGVWKLGGAWADFWTNTTSTGPLAKGNTVYILGSGVPNPSSYTYDYTATSFTPAPFNSNDTFVFAADPATPNYKAPPDTTGGMPVIKFAGASVFAQSGYNHIVLKNLWFVGGSGIVAGSAVITTNINSGASYSTAFGCVLDQFGFDIGFLSPASAASAFGNAYNVFIGCEAFSSQGGSGGTHGVLYTNGTTNPNSYPICIGCNFHDCVGYGIYWNCTASFNTIALDVRNCIIAKCSVDGIYIDSFAGVTINNNTIDGNGGNGITIGSNSGPYTSQNIFNNIISNHTGVGKFGISAAFSVTNTSVIDYNTFYNNTADLSNLSYGPHDTHGGLNPYLSQSIEDYTLV